MKRIFGLGVILAALAAAARVVMGRRHGDEGILKYTEPQTVAEQRFVGIDRAPGIPKGVYRAVTPYAVRALKYLPGR